MNVFDDLLTDNVTLLKTNGIRIESIKASMQTNMAFIHRSDILIESGDLLYRKMSNGGEETYEVIDPGFHETFHEIEAHYQARVKKLGIPEAKKAVQNITINQYGDNSRVNQNSIDNSVNINNKNNELSKYIDDLKTEIEKNISNYEEKEDYFEIIDAVQEQLESKKPKKSVVKSLLSSLPTVASIASIVQAILSMV